MRKIIFLIVIMLVVAISGCTQQNPNNNNDDATELQLPDQPIVYTFSNPVKQALLYPISDSGQIRYAILSSKNIDMVFDGSSSEDNAYFQTTLFNIVQKTQTYSVYNGRIVNFNTYYFIGDKWYNSTTDRINRTESQNVIIWIKGPNTNAKENSVSLSNNTVYVQGMNYKNLTLAADRLVLTIIGVEKLP
ncbi:hypothetical protein HYZ41_03205 [archaeon]|nr:hypothetical protein [archaeon]